MEIGSEISGKIRSAIKAKLVDLGAYVDDELPDYIMVMVANKKTKQQMTDDLNLFLGENTENFTQWLHVQLGKLQKSDDDKGKLNDSSVEKPMKDKKRTISPPRGITKIMYNVKNQEQDVLNLRVPETDDTFDDDEINYKAEKYNKPVKKSYERVTSVVGSVLHHSDDEYDPVLTSVQSRIDVVRKNRIPPALQPNKSILIKAMSAANMSVDSSKKHSKKSKHKHRSRSPIERNPSPPNRPTKRYEINKEKKIIKNKSPIRKRKGPSAGIFIKEDNEGQHEDCLIMGTQFADKRRVLDNSLVNQSNKNCEEQRVMDAIFGAICSKPKSFNDKSQESDDDEETLRRKALEAAQKKRTHSPSFIVTLDGIDPEKMDAQVDLNAPIDESDIVNGKSNSAIAKIKPMPQQPLESNPSASIQPFTINLKIDSDDDDDLILSKSETDNLQEKCRFWPNCINSTCTYLHPQQPCKKFPNCKFGEKCLYVHPACKFNNTCSRTSCPYTHTTKISLLDNSEKKLKTVICRFHPKCTNMTCPFNHPKMCRYGIGCIKKKTCLFSHPELPTREQLKWKAPIENIKEDEEK